MDPHAEAGAMIAHYLKAVTRAAGLRWTAQNDADMVRLTDLLADAGLSDSIPAYSPSIEPSPAPARPAQRQQTGPRRSSSITSTSTPQENKRWLNNLAAANGFDTTKGSR